MKISAREKIIVDSIKSHPTAKAAFLLALETDDKYLKERIRKDYISKLQPWTRQGEFSQIEAAVQMAMALRGAEYSFQQTRKAFGELGSALSAQGYTGIGNFASSISDGSVIEKSVAGMAKNADDWLKKHGF